MPTYKQSDIESLTLDDKRHICLRCWGSDYGNCDICALHGINKRTYEELEQQLEAAKQRELELLAVIAVIRDRFFPANQPERNRDELWELVNGTLNNSSQALREHEAKVLEEAGEKLDDMWVKGELQTKGAGNELRRMAEERRKK